MSLLLSLLILFVLLLFLLVVGDITVAVTTPFSDNVDVNFIVLSPVISLLLVSILLLSVLISDRVCPSLIFYF